MISSRSVIDGVSLLVSKSKLVYSSLKFVDYKLALMCLLTRQQLLQFCIFEDKRLRQTGRVTQSTIFGLKLRQMLSYFENPFNSKMNNKFVMK